MTNRRKILLIAAVVIAAPLLLFGGCWGSFYYGGRRTVITKPSPDNQHVARLVRQQWIDVNFKVSVDRKGVYRSPDFAPVPADFREQLIWDTNSQRVILEIAGKRIFGYHAVEKRPLADSELRDFTFIHFEQLRFEGSVPNEGGTNAPVASQGSSAASPGP
jgi:hypothetical protein